MMNIINFFKMIISAFIAMWQMIKMTLVYWIALLILMVLADVTENPWVENIAVFLIILDVIAIPVTWFREIIWDFTIPFQKIFDTFARHPYDTNKSAKANFLLYRVGGTIFSCILSLLLIVTVGYLRPSKQDTYRYKQLEYEAGDTVKVGEHAFIGIDLYDATVIERIPGAYFDGDDDDLFYQDAYILDNGETVYRTRILGKVENRNGLLWIPKSYYYGTKYMFQSTGSLIKWALTPSE